jgi:hypothetical protein
LHPRLEIVREVAGTRFDTGWICVLSFGVWEETGEKAYWAGVHWRHTAAFHAVGYCSPDLGSARLRRKRTFFCSAAAFDLTRQ